MPGICSWVCECEMGTGASGGVWDTHPAANEQV